MDGIKSWEHYEFPKVTMVECQPRSMHQLVTDSKYTPHIKGWVNKSFAGCDYETLERISKDGHLKSVTKARKFAAELRRGMPHTGSVPVMHPAVCGGGLSVPTYLAGNPLCFHLPEYMAAATEPITMWVALNCWGGIKHGKVAERSLSVLGLASLVNDERPVDLRVYQYSTVMEGNGEACLVYPLGVRPVDWAMSGALLGHTGMYRAASFGVISTETCGKEAKKDGRYLDPTGYGKDMSFGEEDRRKLLGMRDDDIHVGVWSSSDAKKEPKQWVQDWYDELVNKGVLGITAQA